MMLILRGPPLRIYEDSLNTHFHLMPLRTSDPSADSDGSVVMRCTSHNSRESRNAASFKRCLTGPGLRECHHLNGEEDCPNKRSRVDEERDPYDRYETITDDVDQWPEAHACDLRGQQISAHLSKVAAMAIKARVWVVAAE